MIRRGMRRWSLPRIGPILASGRPIMLTVGDQRSVETQFVRARWVLIAVVAPLVSFLPIGATDRAATYALIGGAAFYNALVHFYGIRRWAHTRILGRATSIGDALFTAASVAYTGGLTSSLFAAFFLVVITVAFRHGARGSLAIAVLLAGLYGAIVLPNADIAVAGPAYAIRISFVFIIAAFAGLLADQVSVSYARLNEQLNRSKRLVAANSAIPPSVDLDAIVRRVATAATELVDGSATVVILEGQPNPEWHIAAGVSSDLAAEFAELVAEFDDLSSPDPEVREVPASPDKPSTIQSIVVAPLSGYAGPLGRLLIARATDQTPYSGFDLEVVQVLAQQAGLTIDIAHLYAELRNQLAELELAQEQATQSAKLAAIGELAANVAHELNNPLTGVLMHLGLIAEQVSDPQRVRASTRVMEQEVIRMRDIVRDLLDFARKSETQPAPTNIIDVLRSSISLVSHRKEMHTIDVRWNTPEVTPFVEVDANQFKQVFVNLFNNAIDAMGETGRLTIRLRAGQTWVRVDISDTGHGIADEHMDRVFDPFFTTKPRGVGTGLGLSVIHGIVTKHGGTITCASTEGEGTTFTVRLPVAQMVELERVDGR